MWGSMICPGLLLIWGPSPKGTPPPQPGPPLSCFLLHLALALFWASRSQAAWPESKWTNWGLQRNSLSPWDAWSRPAWHCPVLQSLTLGLAAAQLALGSWHWAVASVPLVPSPAPSPSSHAWAHPPPISKQQPFFWLLALSFHSLSCSFV